MDDRRLLAIFSMAMGLGMFVTAIVLDFAGYAGNPNVLFATGSAAAALIIVPALLLAFTKWGE